MATEQADAGQDTTKFDQDLRREVELEKIRQPWWHKPIPAASIVSILAATVPITTGIWGNIEKDRELKAQASKQAHEASMEELKLKHSIQMDYLDRLKNDSERVRTLRMVEATSEDPKMIAWAHQEKDVIEIDMRTLQKQIDDQKSAADLASKKLEEAIAAGNAKATVIAQLQANATRQQQQLDRLRGTTRAEPTALGPSVSSPDGKRRIRIVNGEVCVVDLTTSALVMVLRSSKGFESAAFSPDGSQIVTSTLGGGLQVYDSVTGALVSGTN